MPHLGALVAIGLGAVIVASPTAFTVLQWGGAIYLVWLGLNLIFSPQQRAEVELEEKTKAQGSFVWMRRGFLTNLLNPKVGIFYLSFLPQFLPHEVEATSFVFLLAFIHAGLGLAWFVARIAATRRIAETLRRPRIVRWLNRGTGCIFLSFGVRLAIERRM